MPLGERVPVPRLHLPLLLRREANLVAAAEPGVLLLLDLERAIDFGPARAGRASTGRLGRALTPAVLPSACRNETSVVQRFPRTP